ncbi:MAG: hypothetical protein A2068_08820 [Ignavibacteria bacterium GWB2_35_6b]|nr:MAG: hypothetical protein A2068_08820 [Ignavibacteria bacterium GWB2_35_6b]
MMRTKIVIKKTSDGSKKKNVKKPEIKTVKKYEDVERLVYLLQVHQVELEHQNQELRIAQEEVEVSRNKYVNLFDFSPVPYFTISIDGLIKEVNLRASKMLEIDRSKLIGKRFDSFIPLDDKDVFISFIKTVFASSVKSSCEIKIINKNKHAFHALLEGLKLEDTIEMTNQCQVALIDLTEYKRIENSLINSNEELRLINNTKDKFFSIIAHDLRSPFQSLLSYSELLATEIDTLSHEELILFSKGLHDNLNNFYGLLENLLHWSIMQRNMLEYKPINLNLYETVNKIIRVSNQIAGKKYISLVNKVEPETLVYADVDMLSSVVQNLIINAVKFTNSGGGVIVSAKSKDGFVEVSVKDNGIGIESEKSSQLFNFNTIFTTHGTAGEKGTGLGLPLCKEFVERNNGKIWVESELGKGSKFIFTLRKAAL